MKNSEYWENRVGNEIWNLYNTLEKKNLNLKEVYEEAILDIEEELFLLQKKLNSSNPTLSDMHKFNRLSKLKENMTVIIKELTKEIEQHTKKQIEKAIENAYSKVMSSLGETEFALPNKKLMEMMMNNPWSGETFSERLWGNSKVLARNLNEILVRGLAQGKTIVEMSKELEQRMQRGIKEAQRLVRTETMHYLNESAYKAYEDAGIKQIEILAALDERTCPICGAEHRKVYKMKDRPILPLHVNCRCTYIPVIYDNKKEDIYVRDKAKILSLVENSVIDKEKFEVLYNKFELMFNKGIKTPIGIVKNKNDRFYHIVFKHRNLMSEEGIERIKDTLENPLVIKKAKDKNKVENNGYIKKFNDKTLLVICKNDIITAYYPTKNFLQNKIESWEVLWEKK